MTKEELQMKQTIKKLRSKIHSNNKLRKRYVERLVLAKNTSLDVLMKKLTVPAKTFVKMQFSQAGKCNRGRRFTLRQKILALSLYKISPKSYRVLSEICILPKRSTLNGLLKKVLIKPGINKCMFDNLKKRVEKMPQSHKFCSVVFDEMAIAAHVEMTDEKIIGFVDDGETRKPQLADHALVFLVRGIIKKYKQPVHYTFCAGSTPFANLKKYIVNVIEKLQDCGLKVVATVCDQGATNMAAINSLINDTRANYLRKGEEYPGGLFTIGGQKVFPLYDPPHLMKGIRNNMLNKDLTYVIKNKKRVAKWRHIINLHEKGPGYGGVRLVPKLTQQHVLPHLIPKMRVKHCTQVFSSSVATTLGFLAGGLLTRFLYLHKTNYKMPHCKICCFLFVLEFNLFLLSSSKVQAFMFRSEGYSS